jgi:hypothetical protein
MIIEKAELQPICAAFMPRRDDDATKHVGEK